MKESTEYFKEEIDSAYFGGGRLVVLDLFQASILFANNWITEVYRDFPDDKKTPSHIYFLPPDWEDTLPPKRKKIVGKEYIEKLDELPT